MDQEQLKILVETVDQQLRAFKAAARKRVKDCETLDRIDRYSDELLKGLVRNIRELADRDQGKYGSVIPRRELEETLAEKTFMAYTEEDVRRMEDLEGVTKVGMGKDINDVSL